MMTKKFVKALIDAYDEYIVLLAESEAGLYSLAHVHGFRFSPTTIASL
jgi:hypothetical protein